MTEWIGCDVGLIACGLLEEMLDDGALQQSIANREIACIATTTRSVLRTREHVQIGTYRTVIIYFFDERTLYSDAVSAPAAPGAAQGYKAVPMDEFSPRW